MSNRRLQRFQKSFLLLEEGFNAIFDDDDDADDLCPDDEEEADPIVTFTFNIALFPGISHFGSCRDSAAALACIMS